MYLLQWVDDIFIGCNDVAMRGTFMKSFMAEFRVKDLGALRQGLGASIMQDLEAGTVTLSLATYIGDVARKFDLSEDVSWADIPVPVALYKECVAAVGHGCGVGRLHQGLPYHCWLRRFHSHLRASGRRVRCAYLVYLQLETRGCAHATGTQGYGVSFTHA